MTLWLILLLAGMAAAWWMRRRYPAGARRALILLAGLALLAVFFKHWGRERPEHIAMERVWEVEYAGAERLGAYIARQHPEGGRLLILTGFPDAPHERRRIDALARGAGERFEMAALRPPYLDRVAADEALVELGVEQETLMPWDAFLEAAAKGAPATAILSTRWVPHLGPGQRPPPDFPPLYLLHPGDDVFLPLGLMEQGLVKAFLMPRPPHSPRDPVEPHTDEDPFLLITPETMPRALEATGIR